MAVGKWVAGVLPVAGATVAAMALTGVAVFAVSQAGCADAGRYIQHDGFVELVGGCLDPADLPNAPAERQQDGLPTNPGPNQFGGLNKDLIQP
jgi:hypothetical protein